ncbi:glycosyltransferase [Cryobacterium sp. TMT1-19]|uniref:glycosyltransferase n=1 Tax=unclassified Cryobacterium TaxID=2649013 RepID=UPI000CE34DF8|nr:MULTISPECIES: glycosyltransferase [unclassified Cryobacterium]TFD36918.1 glycosyltransferase [Cryobacterium sp. TMT1-19]
MRILVYPHDLGLGGSQLNAIEIAAAVQALGHSVVIFGRPGALIDRIEDLGLEFVESPRPGKRPSLGVVAALTNLIDEREIDILHGYEWPPALETVLASRRRPAARSFVTVMSMSVPPFIPRTVPLVVGTAEIAAAERSNGRRRVSVLEPPVDVSFNRADLDVGLADFRRRWHLDGGKMTVVSVTRFAHELKLEGTLAAMDAVARVNRDIPTRLVLVGDGPARGEVEAKARFINAQAGEGTIVLTGQISDPRPAYAAADVSLGMGGSALRALAFAKPLVVQGEQGFWRLLAPDSVQGFLWTGWYGVGRSSEDGADTLAGILREVLSDGRLRRSLGSFGRDVVEDRFSVTRAAGLQVEHYSAALAEAPGSLSTLVGDAAAFARYARYYAGKRVRRALGREQADDFNARPVSGSTQVLRRSRTGVS